MKGRVESLRELFVYSLITVIIAIMSMILIFVSFSLTVEAFREFKNPGMISEDSTLLALMVYSQVLLIYGILLFGISLRSVYKRIKYQEWIFNFEIKDSV